MSETTACTFLRPLYFLFSFAHKNHILPSCTSVAIWIIWMPRRQHAQHSLATQIDLDLSERKKPVMCYANRPSQLSSCSDYLLIFQVLLFILFFTLASLFLSMDRLLALV